MKTTQWGWLLGLALLGGCAGYDYGHWQAGNMMLPAMFKDKVLVAHGGKTLYSFDKDKAGSGSSACYGDCAVKWPPYLAMNDAKAHGDFGMISRSDGSKQWTYKGWPLYFWFADKNPGDKLGDNVNNVWHVIKP